jgi:hypothetical protein
LFGILNIGKYVFASFKAVLNFYPAVGPLLGLYVLCIIIYMLLVWLFSAVKIESQKLSLIFFVVGIVIFFFLVFPPVYEPIVHLIAGH